MVDSRRSMGLGTPFLKAPGNLIREFCLLSFCCPGRAESWAGCDTSSSRSSTSEDMGKLGSPFAEMSLLSDRSSAAVPDGEETEFDSVMARRFRFSRVEAEKPCWKVKNGLSGL